MTTNFTEEWILVTDVRGNWLRFGDETYSGRKLAREWRDYFREVYPFAGFKEKKLYQLQQQSNINLGGGEVNKEKFEQIKEVYYRMCTVANALDDLKNMSKDVSNPKTIFFLQGSKEIQMVIIPSSLIGQVHKMIIDRYSTDLELLKKEFEMF